MCVFTFVYQERQSGEKGGFIKAALTRSSIQFRLSNLSYIRTAKAPLVVIKPTVFSRLQRSF